MSSNFRNSKLYILTISDETYGPTRRSITGRLEEIGITSDAADHIFLSFLSFASNPETANQRVICQLTGAHILTMITTAHS